MSFKNNDLATLNDQLEWRAEIEDMLARMTTCPTPHVIGIHGDWGSGKTSFMRQLQYMLGGNVHDGAPMQKDAEATLRDWQNTFRKRHEKAIVTVWFDAWRYQNEPSLVVALLQEIRKQLPLAKLIPKIAGKILSVATRTLIDGIGSVSKIIGKETPISFDVEKFQSHAERYDTEHHAETLFTTSIHEHLKETFEALLPRKEHNARIIIFIDDLDRCNPKAAMRLLEGLKIYLNIEKCVFVLGMNENVLIDAIADEFSSLKNAPPAELSLRACHYFEKICTDIYRLPLPASNVALFAQWVFENLTQAALVAAPAVRPAEYKKAIIEALGDTQVLPPNPRRIKALANQWQRFANCVPMPTSAMLSDPIALAKQQKLWAVRTLIVTYIHQFNRDLWERWRFNPEFWDEITAWCKNPSKISEDSVKLLATKEWASALKPAVQNQSNDPEMRGMFASNFPNPGDQTVFWLSELILSNLDDLKPRDFDGYLKKQSSL